MREIAEKVEKKKTTTVKATVEIHKQISKNERRNMQEVVMKEAGDIFYTRHIPLDSSKTAHPKRRTFSKTK
jgi:hypothetical protein